MFTDEKMELVYKNDKNNLLETLKVLMETMPSEHISVDQLRHTNHIWQLFCTRHPELRPDGFCNIMCQLNPGKEMTIRTILEKGGQNGNQTHRH